FEGSKKQLRVGYVGQNGHSYEPIGRYLWDVIPKEQMSLQKIERHLRSLTSEQRQELFNKNPSYVFFRELDQEAVTFMGSPVVPGRTIATDHGFFPKGSLALLQFERPHFNSPEDEEPASWQPVTRVVFDQDTGGAIRGPHRVDLFWGAGPEAKQASGVMKQKGRLVYFVPRKELLARLAETRSPSSQD